MSEDKEGIKILGIQAMILANRAEGQWKEFDEEWKRFRSRWEKARKAQTLFIDKFAEYKKAIGEKPQREPREE